MAVKGQPDPSRIPTHVVKKIADVVRSSKEKNPDTKVCQVTCTLEIDKETGKIADAFFVHSYDADGTPRYGVVTLRRDGCSYAFGKAPKRLENE